MNRITYALSALISTSIALHSCQKNNVIEASEQEQVALADVKDNDFWDKIYEIKNGTELDVTSKYQNQVPIGSTISRSANLPQRF